MGSAIFTGVTGLLAQQEKLNVVANNIANVNTTGYRGSRVSFEDLFSQTLAGGTGPVNGSGGTNPEQVGLGVGVGSVDMNQGQGSLTSTGVASDLAIQGNGFFILNDGSGNYYTRDGSFSLNANGALIDPGTGMKVQGYTAKSGVVNTNAAPADIVIPEGSTSIVQATQNVSLGGNLISDAAAGTTVTRALRVYDSLGTAHDVTLTFTKAPQVTDGGTQYDAWQYSAQLDSTDVTNVPAGSTGVLLFDTTGALHAEGAVDASNTFTARAGLPSPNQVSVPASAFTGATVPTTPFDFAIDFSKATELSGSSDLTTLNQDGYPRGVLSSFTVSNDGSINGVFTNGMTQVLGQVALADFGNVGGLSRTGNNMFADTPSSGPAQVGAPNTGGRGTVSGGSLEGSNVDLGTEFSNMIVTQRAYQANARTVTTADTLMQEVLNLIR